MKCRSLIAYLVIVALLSTGIIILIKSRQAYQLISVYMLGPAIAAFLTRLFFHEGRFKDANLRIGRLKDYIKFWALATAITALSFAVYTLLGSVRWDFSGQIFLNQLAAQLAFKGKSLTNLPAGLTPRMMLAIYFIGGLTVFNIIPGIITGFGEEFGWRGLMFPEMYKTRPWVAFIVGGSIWFAWHVPLLTLIPRSQGLSMAQNVLNNIVLVIGSICTHTVLAYVYVKSENALVASVVHITLDNVARSLAYFAVVTDSIMANVGLTITMLITVTVLYLSKEFRVFGGYFDRNSTIDSRCRHENAM